MFVCNNLFVQAFNGPMRIALFLLACCVGVGSLRAGNDPEGFRLAVDAGVALPSDDVARVYDIVRGTEDVWTAYDAAASVGLHVGARARIGISESMSFVGGIAYNRFFDVDQRATLENGRVVTLSAATNIIPVHAGIQLFLARWVLSPYISGEVAYTMRNVTVSDNPDPDFVDLLQDRGIEIEPTVSRFGGSVAAGIEIALGPLHPFVEAKVMSSNLIGREAGEPSRTFVSVSLGVTF